MTVGVTIGLALRNADAEKTFLETFTKALDHISQARGLVEFTPAKVLGRDFEYLLHTVWRDEESLNLWLDDDGHLGLQKAVKPGSIVHMWSQRWTPTGEKNVQI